MNIIKKKSYLNLRKFDKNNNKFKLLKYKTDRNSQEKVYLLYIHKTNNYNYEKNKL